MKISKFLISILSISFALGQVSHADLVQDLLGDFKETLVDTSGQHKELRLFFTGDEELSTYLNKLENKVSRAAGRDTIHVENVIMLLSINRNPDQTSRNSSHTRKLNLTMTYQLSGEKREWSGGISDKCSDEQISQFMAEELPIPITGDFLETQPSSLRVIMISFLSLSILAALYFVRT